MTIRLALNVTWEIRSILLAFAAFVALRLKMDVLWVVLVGAAVSLLVGLLYAPPEQARSSNRSLSLSTRGGILSPMKDEDLQSPTAKHFARSGLWLVSVTLAYNVVEAGIAIWAGTEADSIALFGFGLDSVIEIAAAAVLLWRLSVEVRSDDTDRIERAERRVHRFIGLTFLALATYVVIQAVLTLASHSRPEASVVGIVLAAASLVIMPLIAWAKLRVARRLGSEALGAEAKETLACAYLSLALLLGLVLNAAAGWWWADPVAALVMVPWLVKEGVEGLRGEGGETRLVD